MEHAENFENMSKMQKKNEEKHSTCLLKAHFLTKCQGIFPSSSKIMILAFYFFREIDLNFFVIFRILCWGRECLKVSNVLYYNTPTFSVPGAYF